MQPESITVSVPPYAFSLQQCAFGQAIESRLVQAHFDRLEALGIERLSDEGDVDDEVEIRVASGLADELREKVVWLLQAWLAGADDHEQEGSST